MSEQKEDSLLELHAKLDMLLTIIRSQDLNIKILSNKVNTLLNNQVNQVKVPNISIEADNIKPQTEIYISSEKSLQVEKEPVGFRRTSRPETFSNVKSKPKEEPVQKPIVAEAMIDLNQAQNINKEEVNLEKNEQKENSIPVEQRVLDVNGKSIFLADVEVIDIKTGDKVTKVRTNGIGKWSCMLRVGKYKLIISKRDSISKEKSQVMQDIVVDGSAVPLKLPNLIFKQN